MREGNVTGRLNAPVAAFAMPFPSMTGPDQSTVTDLEKVAIDVLNPQSQIHNPSIANRQSPIANRQSPIYFFFPFAVIINCTATPAIPNTSAATASSTVAGSGLSGYTL